MTRLCLVFDIDDTLYLERTYVRSGFEAVGREVGLPAFAERAWAAFEQGRRGNTFDVVLAELGAPPEPGLVPRLVAAYRAHRPRIQLLDDAARCLEQARSSAVIAVVTDGPRVSQRAKAEALGLERWSDIVICTDDLGPDKAKPAPHAFQLAQKRAGVRAADCIYVGDNPSKDFAAPHALGWRCVRVRRPLGLHEHAPSADDVDIEVDHLGDLLELV